MTYGAMALEAARQVTTSVGRPARGTRVVTVAEVSRRTGIPIRTIECARRLLRRGSPTLIDHVERGLVTLTDADRYLSGIIVVENPRVALYRHFDRDGVLLYVGIATAPDERMRRHAKSSPWVERAVSFTGTWYDTWELAKAAETEAIKAERPLFNIAENGS